MGKLKIFTRSSNGYFLYTYHCCEECPYKENIHRLLEKEIFDATINREGDFTSGFNNLYYAPNYESLIDQSRQVCNEIYDY